MAANAAGLTLEDFTRWSEGGANFKGDADCAQTWGSFRDGGGVTSATLFGMAC
jgi:hypothetical protein